MDTPESFRVAERLLRAGTRLSAEQLASLLERHPQEPLPDIFREYLIGMLRQNATLPRGRKKRDGARWDFTVADIMNLYTGEALRIRDEDQAKRAQARSAGEILPRAEETAHDRAAQHVLDEMRAKLGNMSAKRLLNIMADWKRREVPEEVEIPPDENDPPDHEPHPQHD